MIEEVKRKRGRPRKTPEQKEQYQEANKAQKEIVEVFKEIVKYIPEPRLEGFALYKALKEKGYYQGGGGYEMEDPNGIERAYIPTYQEVITNFIGDPDLMDKMRDSVIRAYIELQ